MIDALSEGISFGGTASSTPEMVLPQNLSCTLLDITNLSQTKWLHCALGSTGVGGSTGIAIKPNGHRTLNMARGRFYVWTADETSVPYSGFYCN